MLKNQFKFLVFICFISLNTLLFSQSNGLEFCFHVEQTNHTPKLLQYLFQKYGVEASETILLNVKNYELNYDVHVFYKDEYYLLLERLEQLISLSIDADEIERLNQKKSKLVLFDSIEAELVH